MICCNIKKFIMASMSIVAMIILTITCVISAGAVDNENTTEIDYYYGDANNDSAINVKDCTYIQKCINKSVVPEDYNYYITVADVNQDSGVNIKDTTVLQKYINGLYSSLPITPDTPRPTVIYTTTTTTQTTTPTTPPPVNDDEGYNNHVYKP